MAIDKEKINKIIKICECIADGGVPTRCVRKYTTSTEFYKIINNNPELKVKVEEAKILRKKQQLSEINEKATLRIIDLLQKGKIKKTIVEGVEKGGKFIPKRVKNEETDYVPSLLSLARLAGIISGEDGKVAGEQLLNKSKREKRTEIRRSILQFISYFWDVIEPGRELIVEPHIKFICKIIDEHVGRLVRGNNRVFDWIVVNVPPASSKSSIFSIMLPVWLWIRDPSMRIITSSHTGTLSNRFAKRSREIIRSEKFKELFGDEFEILKSADSVRELMTNMHGMRVVTSVGASITGSHADVIIVDDPLDAQSENSTADIQEAIEHIKAISTRQTDAVTTLRFLVMQRIALGDPTDYLLELGNTDEETNILHIRLPAKNTYDISPDYAKQLYDKETGLLAPIRLSEQQLNKAKAGLGTLKFVAQFMQSPVNLGGNIVKQDWFVISDIENIPKAVFKQPMLFTVDTAYEDKESSDPTGILAWRKYKGKLYIFNFLSKRIDSADLPAFIQRFVNENEYDGRSMIWVENKASGKTVVQLLKKHYSLNVKEYKVSSKSKGARLRAISAPIEVGKCIVVKGGYVDGFVSEVCSFPKGKHDEAVDCLTMAGHMTFIKGKTGGYSAST